MDSRRLKAVVAVLVGIAVVGLGPSTAAAQGDAALQSDGVVIELNFMTTTGEPPESGAAVLDLNSGIEYRNDQVEFGAPIEVDGAIGVVSRLQIRRTGLDVGTITCEGATEARTVPTSLVVITPGEDRVVCEVTLSDELPLTGPSPLASIGALLLGAGLLAVGLARSDLA